MSNRKEKKFAFGGALFLHLIIIALCFVFKLSFSAEKNKDNFSGVIYLESIDLNANEKVKDNKEDQEEIQEKEDQEEIREEENQEKIPDKKIDPKLRDIFDPKSPSKSNQEKIKGCIDSTAANYNENATDDDGSCQYAIEDMEGSYLLGKRQKRKSGKLEYNCDVIGKAVIYECDITVYANGSVKAKCRDRDGAVGNSCFEKSATSAAENFEFDPIESDGSQLFDFDGTTSGKLLFTFFPD